jgi:hypothetical protein
MMTTRHDGEALGGPTGPLTHESAEIPRDVVIVTFGHDAFGDPEPLREGRIGRGGRGRRASNLGAVTGCGGLGNPGASENDNCVIYPVLVEDPLSLRVVEF